MANWDERFLKLAEHIGLWSKDPNTKVGAVIVRPDRTIASVGYNGFPRGMDDAEELYNNRVIKYQRVIHAELNALLNAKESVKGYTLYTWELSPCHRCAVHLIQSGIKRVVSREEYFRDDDSHNKAKEYFKETGVEFNLI